MYNKPIDYKFLNMDTRSFVINEQELLEHFKSDVNSGNTVTKRIVYSSPEINQAIVAYGTKPKDSPYDTFSECAVVLTANKIQRDQK